jgi:hypothetical protein
MKRRAQSHPCRVTPAASPDERVAPIWALIVLALDIFVIWAIATHGDEATMGGR